MERLTEFHNGIWGMSTRAVKDGYDRYSVFSLLAEYEDTGLTPQNIICREDDIKLLQRQNKEFREEILRLRAENAKLYDQLMETEKSLLDIQEERDYWEREAKKYCAEIGEIRILAEQELCDK